RPGSRRRRSRRALRRAPRSSSRPRGPPRPASPAAPPHPLSRAAARLPPPARGHGARPRSRHLGCCHVPVVVNSVAVKDLEAVIQSEEKDRESLDSQKPPRSTRRCGGSPPCPTGVGGKAQQHLRHVEKDVLIPKIMREKARERCSEQVQDFTKCCKDSGVLMVVKCRKENSALKDCLTSYYKDPAFYEECKMEYLKEREEFRRTGIPTKKRLQKLPTSM
uniref:Uncharacterized protein n=1 Tax=Ovis aries TaxID=9940 RepID=A0AC11DZJ8_SHEEP